MYTRKATEESRGLGQPPDFAHIPADGEIPDFIAPALYTLCVLTGNAQRIQCGFCRSHSRHRRPVRFLPRCARGLHRCKGEDMHPSIHPSSIWAHSQPGGHLGFLETHFLSLVSWPDASNYTRLFCSQSCILLGMLVFVDSFRCLTLRTSVLIFWVMALPSMGTASAQWEGLPVVRHHKPGLSSRETKNSVITL